MLNATNNDELDDLVKYMRNYISYTNLLTSELNFISRMFTEKKAELEKVLLMWESGVFVKWPHQSTFDAFMSYLFFPTQFDLPPEISSQLILREPLQHLIACSALHGNLLAKYYLAEILEMYSFIYRKKKAEKFRYLKPSYRKELLELSEPTNQDNLPPFYGGILLNALGQSSAASNLFQRGADKDHPECLFELAMSIKIPRKRPDLEVKQEKIINKLMSVHSGLGHYARACAKGSFEQKLSDYITAGEQGIPSGYHGAALLHEKKGNIAEALKYYRLAASHNLVCDYEKVAMLAKQSGHIDEFKQALKEGGNNGDSLDYLKLSEYILAKSSSSEARGSLPVSKKSGFARI